MMSKRAEMIGKKFGRLEVLAEAGHLGGHLAYSCKCDCGKEIVVRGYSMRSGNTESCGCAFREGVSQRFYKHGMKRSPEYATWQMMISRCTNPSAQDYGRYGARGVTVCDSWRDFRNFYRDMGDRPEGMSIDRIDNDKGYSPENCRWATVAEQNRNTRRTRLIEIGGVTRCLKDWATEYGINYGTVCNRIVRGGWNPVVALTTPAR